MDPSDAIVNAILADPGPAYAYLSAVANPFPPEARGIKDDSNDTYRKQIEQRTTGLRTALQPQGGITKKGPILRKDPRLLPRLPYDAMRKISEYNVDKFDKGVMASLMKKIKVELSDRLLARGDKVLFPSRVKLPSEFERLIPGIESSDIEITPERQDKTLKVGKLQTQLEPFEHFSKLLGGYKKYLADVTDLDEMIVESSLDVSDIRKIDFLQNVDEPIANFWYFFDEDAFYMNFLFQWKRDKRAEDWDDSFTIGIWVKKNETLSLRWCDSYDDNSGHFHLI